MFDNALTTNCENVTGTGWANFEEIADRENFENPVEVAPSRGQ